MTAADKLASYSRRNRRGRRTHDRLYAERRSTGGTGGNERRGVGRVEPSDGKGTQKQSPEAPEGPDQGKKPEQDEDQGRIEKDGQEKRQTEATIATTDREDSAQREDPVGKELRSDRVTKEGKKNKHKANPKDVQKQRLRRTQAHKGN